MSFRLPLSGSPLREALGDMAHVAEVLNPANLGRMQDIGEALRGLRRSYPAGARAVFVIALDSSNDERVLLRVGPKGGWRKVWIFGNGRD